MILLDNLMKNQTDYILIGVYYISDFFKVRKEVKSLEELMVKDKYQGINNTEEMGRVYNQVILIVDSSFIKTPATRSKETIITLFIISAIIFGAITPRISLMHLRNMLCHLSRKLIVHP